MLVLVSCAAPDETGPVTTSPTAGSSLIDSDGTTIPAAPEIRTGPVTPEAMAALDSVWDALTTDIDIADIATIAESGDVRLAWHLSDLLRFFAGRRVGVAALDAFVALTDVELPEASSPRHWRIVTDYLMAWDVPAPPGYVSYKARLYTLVEEDWQPFFDDGDADIDWRLVSWGGVLLDDRPLGTLESCPESCIPALDDPPAVVASLGSWYPDSGIVFGVTVNGESRAYPKNIMEVHEMVNDTLGGRRIGIPYCTLCGSAQVYFTDTVDGEPLVLRTSGLLARSNKVMFDLETRSAFDTFLGIAVSGPLQGLQLEQATVVTTTWGEWKAEHPESSIVARDGGRGIEYPDDPLGGRDDNGPIFPVGGVDQRLPVQEEVLGVTAPDGTVIAFPVAEARAALEVGSEVIMSGVELRRDGGGLRAFSESGEELPAHQAFWFAWSQFQPESAIWRG